MMKYCRQFLLAQGWPESHVRWVDFADRYGSNVQHAEEIEHAVRDLCAAAGVSSIAVVAHSMGGLALRYYLARSGAAAIDSVIFVATPHSGTYAAYFAWGSGGREMRPNSEFLRELNRRQLPSQLRAHCIRTPLDTRVLPGSSAWLAGTQCHVIRAPTHPRMMRHKPTLQLIHRLLLRRD
jgi:triacylglycerol esterase/lipase EstA (alpha/beta hydrolase family)